MIERYSNAVQYFIEHPEAQLNPMLKAMVDSVREELEREKGEGGKAALN